MKNGMLFIGLRMRFYELKTMPKRISHIRTKKDVTHPNIGRFLSNLKEIEDVIVFSLLETKRVFLNLQQKILKKVDQLRYIAEIFLYNFEHFNTLINATVAINKNTKKIFFNCG